MARSRIHGKREITNARAMLFGVCFTAAAFFATVLICAIILGKTENPTSMIGIASTCAFYVTSACAGLATSRYKGEGGVLPAVLSALTFSLVLLVISAIICDGRVPAITAINLGAYVLISALFAIIGKRRAPRRRR